MKILVFDIFGKYAHYKKIYATTSAVSYVIPTKTALYGYIGAILGLEKVGNNYLESFSDKKCLLGIEVRKPIIMQRINTNLRAVLGRMKPNDNRKPTTVEYIYEPEYRIYFSHKDDDLYGNLKQHLQEHTSIYTPTLGLSNLLSDFKFVAEEDAQEKTSSEYVDIRSVIPKASFVKFNSEELYERENEVIEQSMYSIEMDTERNVTERDDIILDRKAKPISASVRRFFTLSDHSNVILF